MVSEVKKKWSFHWVRCSWTRWNDPEAALIGGIFHKGNEEAVIQIRNCTVCGRIQVRRVPLQ